MSLRSKIVAILIPVVAGYGIVDHLLQRSILQPSFQELESEHAVLDMQRTQAALREEIQELEQRARSWAERSDLAAYVQGENPSYPDHWLGALVFRNEGLHLLYATDAAGSVVWGEARTGPSEPLLRLRDFPSGQLAASHRLLNAQRPHQPVAGLWLTEEGPLLVASHPILASAQSEVPAGRLILGRFLSGGAMERVAERTKVRFDVWPLDGTDLPEEIASAVDDATASAVPVVRVPKSGPLEVFATMADARQQPALLLRAHVDRAISGRGATAMRYALFSTMAAGLLFVLVLLRLMQRIVLAPLAQLTEQAVEIGRRDDSSLRLNLQRSDEIGTLSAEFDGMLAKLEASRAEVVSAARSAGMSEIATGILHNVGNVLNSVTVSSGVLDEKLRQSRLAHLEKLVGLVEAQPDLARFVAEDPRGKQLAPFLAAITRQLAEERRGLLEELGHLVEALDHIRELVTAQQAYAGRSTLREPTQVSDQVETALRLTEKAGGNHGSIRIERDLAVLPRIPMDRHKLVEILVNLIQNARQAVQASGREDGYVAVRSRYDDGLLTIAVEDNGVGIAEEHLTKVFHHGFTTKKDGHGFGLHASANAATELGGKLTAHSEGPGRGACFTLTLPVEIETQLARAS